VIVGSLLGVAGLVLVVPAPEVGFALLLVSLRLLALEFEWAARAYEPVLRAWERVKAAPRGVKLGVGVAVVAAVVATAWWLG